MSCCILARPGPLQTGRMILTIATSSPPETPSSMPCNNLLNIFLHQLLLSFLPPIIIVVFLLPIGSMAKRGCIWIAFELDDQFLRTSTHTSDRISPHARPAPLRPLHFIDFFRLPHPLVHMSEALQSLQELSSVPWCEVRRLRFMDYCGHS